MNVRQSYSKLTSYKLILLIILVYKDDMLMSPMKFCMDYMKGSKLFLIYIHIYIYDWEFFNKLFFIFVKIIYISVLLLIYTKLCLNQKELFIILLTFKA